MTAPSSSPAAEPLAPLPKAGEPAQPGLQSSPPLWTSAAFALFLLGLAASAFFFRLSDEAQQGAAQRNLEELGAERSEVLNMRLLRAVDGLRAVGALVTVGESVGRNQFQGYGHEMLQWLPEIDRLQWQPLVSPTERASYEAKAREEGLANFEFVEAGAGGKTVRARDRETHLPVYYEVARSAQDSMLGFDVASNPAQMEYKWLAADTGRATTFIPYRPTMDKGATTVSNSGGVILSLPVYRHPDVETKAERRRQLRGFVAADLRLDELVQSVIAGLPEQGVDVLLYLHTHQHDELIYHRLAKNSDLAVSQNRNLDFIRTLDVAGRQWLLQLHPTPDYLAGQRSRQPELVLLIGILLSCAFAGHLYSSQRQRRRIERANAKLLESQDRFNLFMDNSPGLAFIKDAEGRLVYINKAYAKGFGFTSPEQWLGKTDEDLWPQDTAQSFRDHDLAALAGEKAQVMEERAVRKGRQETWLSVKFPFRDRHGNRYLGGIATNVTERKQAEEQLRLSEQVFKTASEAIAITDANNAIIAVNPAFEQITGYSQDEVIGKNPRILSSGRQPPAFYQRLWQTLAEAGYWQGEIWNRRKNGEFYVEWLSISVARDEAGHISHYIAIFSDISERKQAEDRIQFLAHYDDLTQLPNRTLTRDRLHQALLAADRSGGNVSLLFLDLDRFKFINDSLGHHVGDALLQEVARRVGGCLREVDTVGRLGGDEFLAVLPETDGDGAAHVAQKILDELADNAVIDGHALTISSSIGVAVYPLDGDDIITLMKNADSAMYHAKQAGRGNYQFFNAEMNAAAHEQLRLESGLRSALEKGELELYYQPKVDLLQCRVVGCEALLRWNHPELGVVSPVRFIPVAEECGLIVSIGDWALREACRQMLAFQRIGGHGLIVAVNVSALQFNQRNFVDSVRQILGETGLAPHCLELELTESALMKDTDNALQTMEALSGMGVRLAVDDFGTGYSSLGYLKRFPINCLKIDKGFVRDLETDSDDASIVTAVISLAHSLRLTVVGEGVETEGQLQFLKERGCEEAQGFYFDKPLRAEAFQDILRNPLPAAAE